MSFSNIKTFGAIEDGVTDDNPANQQVIVDGDRCGANCSTILTKKAIIYFPSRTYTIGQPILQYYFTFFIGEPENRAIIKPLLDFKRISLIDTNL